MGDQIYPEVEKHKAEFQKKIDEALGKGSININIGNTIETVANNIEGAGDKLEKLADTIRDIVTKVDSKRMSKYVKNPKYSYEEIEKLVIEAASQGTDSILLDADKIKQETIEKINKSKNFNIHPYEPVNNCCMGGFGGLTGVDKLELTFNLNPKLI